MTLAAGTQIGKYVVRRKIAEGGMAEIYLAASVGPEGFHKDVVIKRIRSVMSGDPDFVEMFIAEARLASQISHANVVQIFDFDKHEDTYYLAMEYVRGRSLWDLRKRAKERMDPMPPLLVAQIGIEVARALHAAHGLTVGGQPMNLVHRDVTPHNVLLSYEGAVKLTDFGIAKAGNRLTAAGVLKGKFAYMSPEQARADAVDHRTDVFALGIVLWELLTGGRLFEGDSDIAVLKSVQQSKIAPPRRLNPEVAPALDDAVMKALARDLDQRFQSAQELERALAACVFGNAKSYDDTDVGSYVRRLFAEEHAAEVALDQEPLPTVGAASSSGAPLAGTAVQRHAPGSGFSGTHVLSGSQRAVLAEPPAPPSEALGEVRRGGTAVGVPGAPRDGGDARAAVGPPGAGAALGEDGVPGVPGLGSRAVAEAPATYAAVAERMQMPPAPARAPRAPKWPLVVGGAALVGAVALLGIRPRLSESKIAAGQGTGAPPTVAAVSNHVGPPAAPGAGPSSGNPAASAGSVAQPSPSSPPVAAPVAGRGQTAAATPPSTTPAPGVTPSTTSTPSASASSTPQTGTILLHVIPWAHLWVDGEKNRDVEGSRPLHLSPGDHEIRLSQKHGFHTYKIHLEPGATKVIRHNALSDANH